MIFARRVSFDILPGKDTEFKSVLNNEILPLLKKQDGFRDEMVLLKENHGMGISLWRTRENINTYNTTVYPEVAKKLTPYLKSQPMVEVYEVTHGTINLN